MITSKVKFCFLLTALVCGTMTDLWSQHDGLNGIYSMGGSKGLYFNEGECYFFTEWGTHTYRRQEHYPYTYDGKTIKFKYTGQFQQEYTGTKVTRIWWRLNNEGTRDKEAYVPIKSLQDLLNLRNGKFVEDYEDQLYGKVTEQQPQISREQFKESLLHPNR